jgi:hypothetical protein
MANYAIVDPVQLGIWAEQVDELMAEVAAHYADGNMVALERLAQGGRRWLRTSPCPNALVIAVNYAQAAVDNPPPGAHWTQPEEVREQIRVALPTWGEVPRERPVRRAPSFIPAGKTVNNWLCEPGEEVAK